MEVTEVRVKLAETRDEKLRAFCTVTFDNCFVVRDIKVIHGAKGYFVAMPSRKLMDLCPNCHTKNHLRSRYCNECGRPLPQDRVVRDEKGRPRLHADIAHPIHREFRAYLQGAVLKAYEEELERAKQPGYRPPQDDFPYDDSYGEEAEAHGPAQPPDTGDKRQHRFGEGILP